MSTKEWVYQSDNGTSLYQEMSFDEHNDNPATIQIEHPKGFKVVSEELSNGKAFISLTAEISATCFDELAIAWIKNRGIQSRLEEYTLEELLAECNFKWPISEEELLDGIDDVALARIVKHREGQEKVSADLEYDNIFDVATDNKEEAERLKAKSNAAIWERDSRELKSAALSILEHIKMDIKDEETLISAIQDILQKLKKP